MIILVSATLGAFQFNTPSWLGLMFAVFACLTMLLYLVAYTYCLFTDKDALRSETYSIQKLAIEKGFVGDDLTGVFMPPKISSSLTAAVSGDDSEVTS